MELNRGHVEYLKQLQNARTIMRPNGSQADAFEWMVQDALMDEGNRQPSYWEIDGGSKFIEYMDAHGHVQRTTLNKYINRHAKGDRTFGEYDIDMVQQMFSGVSSYKAKHFKLVAGDDLVEAYNDNIDGGNGCMRKGKSGFTRWYADNGVQMLIYRNKARALVWKTESGELYVDRIYPNSGAHIFAFHVWAKIHGALVRTNQSLPDSGTYVVEPLDPDAEFRRDLVVRMEEPNSDLYPYVDTFHYMCDLEDDNTRLYHMDWAGAWTHKMQSIRGGPFVRAEECRACKVWEHPDVMFGGYCESCSEDLIVCGHCERRFSEDHETSYTVETGSGDEEWCENCTYGSDIIVCACGCDARASVHDVPDEWFHHTASDQYTCDRCADTQTCDECGEPRPGPRYRFRISRSDNGNQYSGELHHACSRECLDTLASRVQGVLAGETCTAES